MKTIRPLVLAAAAALSFVATQAWADGLDPTKISLPKGPGSIEGLGRNFAPSLSSGTASYGVDIAVPPAAGAFGPRISLEYDAGGGVSEVGMGWRLAGTTRIRRRTENGLPRFDASDAFEIAGVGVPCDLVQVSPGTFRPQFESGAFVRVQQSSDGATWEARDKSGTTSRYGGNGFVEQENGHVVSYLLREQVDLHNHSIHYTWDASSGHALLTQVVWNDFGTAARNEVLFTYEARPDLHKRFSAGIRQDLTKRLASVEVRHGAELVRRYRLSYSAAPHSRLTQVNAVGSDGTTSVPTLTVGYADVRLSAQGQVQAMTSPPGWSPADGDVDLADLNGDGLPDLLVAKAGNYRSYVNHNGIAWQPGVDWGALASPSLSLSTVGVQLADMDGDGAIDLVAKTGTTDFRYFPGKDAISFGPSVPIATVPNFSFEDPDVKLGDMDGDRRVDAVITTAAGLGIAYNLSGNDWAAPVTIGVVDPRQALRFSDGGNTQLCDVNGDRVLDLCYLRSGSLVYYLGRGRGVFEPPQTATGVPTWDPSSPWELHDVDGDGWLDLVHVGVTQVDVALASAAGQFGAPVTIANTPEKLPTTTVRFADMNGNGTTDIVWIDTSGAASTGWQYLDLFPQGRAGLLTRIDNGLGRVTSITYAPASLDAAAARDASQPWTSRMNVAMPVVHRVETDDSIGDPVVAVEYQYANGTWDPAERTFGAFAGGTQTDLGDDSTPTLVTSSTFDPGIAHREMRGAVLTSQSADTQGYVFSRSAATYSVVNVDVGIEYAFKTSESVDLVEGTDNSKTRTTLTEYEQDSYGNTTAERHWGEVVAGNKLAGNDEAITLRTFVNNTTDWILGRVATEELQDGTGHRVAMSRTYYDGLPLGQVSRGDVTRREAWIGPASDAFQLDLTTKYDADGHPIETTDARGGGHLFTWNPNNHATITSESVKLDGGQRLTETAVVDPAFGNLLSVEGYDGQTTSYAYDALGRLTAVFHPGDSPNQPTVRYAYQYGAPLSRVITDSRIWLGRNDFEHHEDIIDGSGRKRATLTQEAGGKWVLAGVSLFNARGSARRTLRPRWATGQEREAPPLLKDGLGVDHWADASGRTLRTRTELGIESRTAYLPFVVQSWDGAQNDPTSPYDHTPHVDAHDGLGRLVSTSKTLGAQTVTSSYAYNAAGHLLSRTDPEGNIATYAYDGRGRRTAIHDPDVGSVEFTYDATGNAVDTIEPDGKHRKNAFDLAGRVLTEDWDGDGKPEVTNTWDRSTVDPGNPVYGGKLVAVEDPGGRIEHEYDERADIVASHHTIDGTTYTVRSQYDALGREYLHGYSDGSTLRIYRNARGQVSSYGKAAAFSYDGDGVEMQRTFNTGVTQLWGYDADRRVQETVAKTTAGAELLHLAWSYDGAGNILELADKRAKVDPSVDRSEHYTYDNLYRLTGATGTWGSASWAWSPSGNLLGRDSSVSALQAKGIRFGGPSAGPHAMTAFNGRAIAYDARGRMTTDGDRSYTWNDDDQLVHVTNAAGASVESRFDLHGDRRLRIERDSTGKEHRTVFVDPWSEVHDGKLVRYILHGGHRLARLAGDNGTQNGGAVALAEPKPGSARALAARIAVACAGCTLGGFTGFVGSAAFPIAVLIAVAWVYREWLRRQTKWLAVGATSAVFAACSGHAGPPPIEDGTVQTLTDADELLLHDQIGSLAEKATGTGKSKGGFAVYPFGLTRYDSTSDEARKFAGLPRDVGVGLDHMGARFYAPDLGVWTSPDPVHHDSPDHAIGSDAAAANAYAYANLSPIVAKDHDGHWWNIAIGAAVGAAVGGGIEAYRQYAATGHVDDWGKVGAKAAVGAVAGAVSAVAGPGAGYATVMGLGAVTGVATGVAERMIDSGGKSAGTVKEAVGDALLGAVTAGLAHGGQKLIVKAVPAISRALGEARGARSPRAPQVTSVKTISASEANAPYVAKGWSPPYAADANVRTFTTATELEFVRVHTTKNPVGAFLARPGEVSGMSSAQLQQHLALPSAPTHIRPVTVPAGTRMQMGRVGPQPDFGAPAKGGVQYELLEKIPSSAFGASTPL